MTSTGRAWIWCEASTGSARGAMDTSALTIQHRPSQFACVASALTRDRPAIGFPGNVRNTHRTAAKAGAGADAAGPTARGNWGERQVRYLAQMSNENQERTRGIEIRQKDSGLGRMFCQ